MTNSNSRFMHLPMLCPWGKERARGQDLIECPCPGERVVMSDSSGKFLTTDYDFLTTDFIK